MHLLKEEFLLKNNEDYSNYQEEISYKLKEIE